MYDIKENHWLQKTNSIKHLTCKKNQTLFKSGQPDTIIIHYTAGSSAESSAKYLSKADVAASAHLVLGRKGEIFQLVPFNTVAWHAGRSSHEGRSGFNNFSIGIEIDNAGVLEKAGEEYKAWFGTNYPASEVIQAQHRNEDFLRYWQTFTEKQIETIEELCNCLIKKYPNISQILGHEEISVGRKKDPGPAFPLDTIRARIFQDRDSIESVYGNMPGFVEADSLNIREAANAKSKKVHSPLLKGTEVLILQKKRGWYRVKTKVEIEGWVSAKYVNSCK